MSVVAELTCNKSARATEVAVPEPAEENQVEEIGPSASAATLAPPAPFSVERESITVFVFMFVCFSNAHYTKRRMRKRRCRPQTQNHGSASSAGRATV